MFIPYKLLGYIGGAMLIAGSIYAGYSYITNLNKNVVELNRQNTQLSEMNDTLSTSIAETERMQGVRDKVSEASNEIREINQQNYQEVDEQIDIRITDNKDKPVGELLNEFFNSFRVIQDENNE